MNTTFFLCLGLLIAGCAAKPPIVETIFVPTPPPREQFIEEPRPNYRPPPVQSVVRHKDALVAAAGHYVASPRSKPPQIHTLTELITAANLDVNMLVTEKDPKKRPAELKAAQASLAALQAGLHDANVTLSQQ